MTTTKKPTLKHHIDISERDKIEDFEVPAFLEDVAPGLKQYEIAQILGVSRNTIGIYMREGMPIAMARALFGWRSAEHIRQAASLDKVRSTYEL